jgi:hypothetical protein
MPGMQQRDWHCGIDAIANPVSVRWRTERRAPRGLTRASVVAIRRRQRTARLICIIPLSSYVPWRTEHCGRGGQNRGNDGR